MGEIKQNSTKESIIILNTQFEEILRILSLRKCRKSWFKGNFENVYIFVLFFRCRKYIKTRTKWVKLRVKSKWRNLVQEIVFFFKFMFGNMQRNWDWRKTQVGESSEYLVWWNEEKLDLQENEEKFRKMSFSKFWKFMFLEMHKNSSCWKMKKSQTRNCF